MDLNKITETVNFWSAVIGLMVIMLVGGGLFIVGAGVIVRGIVS
jgi:hypothetical protein